MNHAGAAPPGPSQETVLAALRRAEIHDPAPHGGATPRALRAHLAIAPRGARARALKRVLAALERDGAVRRARARGEEAWRLTPRGERILRSAARAGRAPALPESPQHRAWRAARAAGRRELARLAAALAAELAEAERMLAALDGAAPPDSDAWLALGPRLLSACRRLGSAWHCAHEWPEPGDERAQRDGPAPRDPLPAQRNAVLRSGRRNVALWGGRD